MGTKYTYKIHNSLSLPFSGLFGFGLFRKGTICFHKQMGKEKEKTIKQHLSEESMLNVFHVYMLTRISGMTFLNSWNGTIAVI